MQTANLLPLVLVLAVVAYGLAFMRSRAVAAPLGGIRNLKALPFYYAARAALWCAIPALIVLAAWAGFEGKVIQGIVIASLVNIFMASPALQFAISAIGVLIFAGLTAYDTQQIKNEILEGRAIPVEAARDVLAKILAQVGATLDSLAPNIKRRHPEIEQRIIDFIKSETIKHQNEASNLDDYLDDIIDDVVTQAEAKV